MPAPSTAQISRLALEAKRAGFDSAAEAAIAAGIPPKRNGRLDPRFDMDSTQASWVITELSEGRLRAESDDDGPIDLTSVSTEDLLAEIARRCR